MNIPLSAVREFAPIVLLLGVVVWGLWTARRRLRPWHLWLPVSTAVVSVPMTTWLLAGARSGQFTGWGGLGLVLLLLPAVFVAALSVTALLTLAVLLPRYGFDTRPAEERKAERAAERAERNSPEGRRTRAVRELKVTAVMLLIALLILKFGTFRP